MSSITDIQNLEKEAEEKIKRVISSNHKKLEEIKETEETMLSKFVEGVKNSENKKFLESKKIVGETLKNDLMNSKRSVEEQIKRAKSNMDDALEIVVNKFNKYIN